jgi:hypothetical protein
LVVPVVVVVLEVAVDGPDVVVPLPLAPDDVDVDKVEEAVDAPCDHTIEMKNWRMKNKGMVFIVLVKRGEKGPHATHQQTKAFERPAYYPQHTKYSQEHGCVATASNFLQVVGKSHYISLSRLSTTVILLNTIRDNGIQTDKEIQNPVSEPKFAAHTPNLFAF